MTEKLRLNGVDKIEAESRIKEIYIDRYGEQNVKTYKALGNPVVKAKGYNDKTKVVGYEDGAAVVDVTDTSQSTRSIIANISPGPNEYESSAVQRGVEQYEEEVEEGTSPVSKRETSEPKTSGLGKHEVDNFGDGSIRFRPRFSQKEASYLEPGDRSYNSNHKICEECAHFIEGGGCHVVEGPISEDGYCEEFYADVGVYGHKHETGIEENLSIFGYDFDWKITDAKEFAMDIRERLEGEIRGET